MKDQKFKDQMRERFDNEVPDVLSKIKSSPDFMIPEKRSMKFSFKNLFFRRIALSFVSVFIIAIALVSIMNNDAETVVASTITLDVNPSIEITLDEDDIVISVVALNNDGDEIVNQSIQYKGMTIDEVLEILVEKLADAGYIISSTEDSNIVLIDVQSNNSSIQSRVETAIEAKLKNELNKYGNLNWVLNARKISLTDAQKQAMMEDDDMRNITVAKSTLIYRIHALDDSYTVRQLATLNVRQLYLLYIELENPEQFEDFDNMPGHGNNNNPGHGN